MEEFVRLLDDLQVCVEDLGGVVGWEELLLDIIKSSEGIQHLSLPYWELLVELTIYWSYWLRASTYSPHVMISLKDAEEWDKLRCWISVVCIV